ncbi:MAG: ABC transporter ATP-binding protein [Paracoccaceae bacterium]|nr:ABC transporter ATP-binding protein [Paracoccaceae bacterium]
MLELSGVTAGYGETQVLHGVDLVVREGQFHAILGRNGAGKTTTLKTIMGLVPAKGGEIRFAGDSIAGREPYRIATLGIAYVPETRDVFGALTVEENLHLAARIGVGRAGGWSIEKVLAIFPNLAERMDNGGNQLSGGEQQMLSIGRALLMNPSLMILDEPTEGLAPIIVRQIFDKLMELKQAGLTLLLVEQNFHFALNLADEVSVFGRGQCIWTGTPDALRMDEDLHKRWIGV